MSLSESSAAAGRDVSKYMSIALLVVVIVLVAMNSQATRRGGRSAHGMKTAIIVTGGATIVSLISTLVFSFVNTRHKNTTFGTPQRVPEVTGGGIRRIPVDDGDSGGESDGESDEGEGDEDETKERGPAVISEGMPKVDPIVSRRLKGRSGSLARPFLKGIVQKTGGRRAVSDTPLLDLEGQPRFKRGRRRRPHALWGLDGAVDESDFLTGLRAMGTRVPTGTISSEDPGSNRGGDGFVPDSVSSRVKEIRSQRAREASRVRQMIRKRTGTHAPQRELRFPKTVATWRTVR